MLYTLIMVSQPVFAWSLSRAIPTLAAATLSLLGLSAAAQAAPPPSYDFDFVTIGAVNNPAYTDGPGGPNGGYPLGRGSVGYEFRMSRLEVTTAQWMAFANVAASFGDDTIGDGINFAGYERDVGSGAHYSLRPIANAATFPVFGIPWTSAAKFCNWLHNDKAANPAALLSGAYDLTGSTLPLSRSPGAQYWIPNVDEWIKAVHYDPHRHGPGQGGYWQFPNSSDTRPVTGPPSAGGQTNAGSTGGVDGSLQFLGSYPDTRTPWGLLDASGCAAEWLEEAFDPSINTWYYEGRSALNSNSTESLDAIWGVGAATVQSFSGGIGIRIASAVPAPSGAVVLGLAGLAGYRRRRSTAWRRCCQCLCSRSAPSSAWQMGHQKSATKRPRPEAGPPSPTVKW